MFVLPDKLAVLEFEEYPGLEVTVRLSPVPMGTYFDIVRRMNEVAGMTEFETIARDFAPIGLVSWNLDGEPTAEGLASQPYELAIGIVTQWIRAVAEVPVPLPKRSSDTEPSEDPETSPSS